MWLVLGCAAESFPDGPGPQPPAALAPGDTGGTPDVPPPDDAPDPEPPPEVEPARCVGAYTSTTVVDGVPQLTVHGLAVVDPEHPERVVSLAVDLDGDGVFVDYSVSWAYDGEGNQVREGVDLGGDGEDWFEGSVWDGDLLLAHVVDEGSDGSLDRATTWDHDLAERVVARAEDLDGDGSVEELYAYAYDGATGELAEVVGVDPIDGRRLFHESTAWSADGLRSVTTDEDGDGADDVLATYAYDEAGRVVHETTDLGIDGALDALTDRTYDPATGLLSVLVRTEAASEHGARVLREWTQYDEDERLVRWTRQEDWPDEGVEAAVVDELTWDWAPCP